MANDNSDVRELIRAALLSGRLSRPTGHHIYGGKGDGVSCACCGETVTPSQVQYDVEWDLAGQVALSMHLRCYDAWRSESAALDDVRDATIVEVAASIAASPAGKRIFQIAYDEKLLGTRARILRRVGYEVISVFGNDAAKVVLEQRPQVDLFVIAHAGPQSVRLEMAYWLKAQHPGIRILALNPPGVSRLDDVEFNAPYNAPPDTWLPLVTAATVSPA